MLVSLTTNNYLHLYRFKRIYFRYLLILRRKYGERYCSHGGRGRLVNWFLILGKYKIDPSVGSQNCKLMLFNNWFLKHSDSCIHRIFTIFYTLYTFYNIFQIVKYTYLPFQWAMTRTFTEHLTSLYSIYYIRLLL